jgi:hypothetical protein
MSTVSKFPIKRATGAIEKEVTMTDTKTKWVTFTPEMIEECEEFCECLTAHYRNNGDRRTAMPWTRDQFTNNELPLWLASRKVAGKQIDIESCEIGWWYVNESLAELVAAAGLNHPTEFRPAHFSRRVSAHEVKSFAELYPSLRPGELLTGSGDKRFEIAWAMASAAEFRAAA